MNNKAMYAVSYGLYLLTAREGEKDNGCVINTLQQVTSCPNRISITVNKQDYTHGMIVRTGVFNVSMLTTETPFEVFRHFGFQSGRDVNKFAGEPTRAENGVAYVGGVSCAYLSGRVVQSVDLGTHTLFIADVTGGEVLSNGESVTYAYYQKNIKPKPQPAKKGWRCRVCGYIYEGDELPADFVCPICKHGAEDFEKIG
jgi:flavin reductase (DIM6/NTAB) family NADH-FMN oxidoreductase RutF